MIEKVLGVEISLKRSCVVISMAKGLDIWLPADIQKQKEIEAGRRDQ